MVTSPQPRRGDCDGKAHIPSIQPQPSAATQKQGLGIVRLMDFFFFKRSQKFRF